MATSPNYGWLEPDNTDLVKNGALAIRTLGNAIDTTMATMTPKSLVDAKGDLIAASANDTPARLAVGNNGETLVADSSTSTGLRYTANFAAGKNKIINGDFGVWQRGTSFSVTSAVYTADRFKCSADTTTTFSQQSFTAGTAPVAGYEGTFFLRAATGAGTSYVDLSQPIEDVRTFAGQTATLSFWAKANSATTLVSFFRQSFGSGGSANVDTSGSSSSLTTSWQRFTFTVAIPSVSGKTIGTGSALIPILYCNSGAASKSIDIWGVQFEAGSVATAFQTATGTIQGELAACQRYYWRSSSTQLYSRHGTGGFAGTTTAYVPVAFPVPMRTAPSSLDYASLALYDYNTDIAVTSATMFSNAQSANYSLVQLSVASGGAQYRPVQLENNVNAGGYIGFSAEL